MRSLPLVSLLTSLCLFASGCGVQPSKREHVYTVTGKITYKNDPVAGADITFFCAEKDRSAFGRTNAQGKFNLTTFSANDGAVAGKHVVVVKKVMAAPPAKIAETTSTAYVPPGFNESTDPSPPET